MKLILLNYYRIQKSFKYNIDINIISFQTASINNYMSYKNEKNYLSKSDLIKSMLYRKNYCKGEMSPR